MLIKIHEAYRKIVAICDAELLGKRFEQGNRQLEVKKEFFGGEKKTENQAIEIIEMLVAEDAMFNLVGSKAINAGIKLGIISKEGIIKIQGIPHALSLL
jgi:hypothetical protein